VSLLSLTVMTADRLAGQDIFRKVAAGTAKPLVRLFCLSNPGGMEDIEPEHGPRKRV
jgi:hypothetical protein